MYLVNDNQAPSYLRTAMALTVAMHILLVIMMPDFPKIALTSLNPLPALNIFITKAREKKKFEQSLNQSLPTANKELALQDPSLGAASPIEGKASLVSEATPKIESLSPDINQANQASGDPTPSKAAIRIDSAFIKMFAEHDVQREVERNPEQLEKFSRSFNSPLNNQQRNKIDSHSDVYGNIYIRVNSSIGDICFKQDAEEGIPNDFMINTVYFFRCKSKPFKFELGPKNAGD